MDDREVIEEFLLESNENLALLDNQMIELERRPKDAALLGSVFRTVHTIKGTCGFLGYQKLEAITHEAETLLSQLRAGERETTSAFVTLMLEVVDAVRLILASISRDGTEGEQSFDGLVARLREAARLPLQEAAPDPGVEPAEEATASSPESDPVAGAPDTAIRVDVRLLDGLMNLVGELVLARNQILQHGDRTEDAVLGSTAQRLDLITTELQESVMRTRMQPIGVVWNKLPRVVRDLSRQMGKQIKLEMDGADTELDRTIIEAIKDPLMHMVRNCGDHAIERPEERVAAGKPASGRIYLRASHDGGQVNIEITDDGRGIDPAKLRAKAIEKGLITSEQAAAMGERESLALIFRPGFSTAASITNVSGRGVGMDVVKSNVERIGGVVDISSRVGEGTTIRLKIPLTLAIIPGLVVSAGGERFVIPQASLVELLRLEGEEARKQIECVQGASVLRRRGGLLPVARLNQLLELPPASDSDVVSIVVLECEERHFGLIVDAVHDTQEIVVKPLGQILKGLSVYAGATIMGDGRVALILDVAGLGARSGLAAGVTDIRRSDRHAADLAREGDVEHLLLIAAGSYRRVALPLARVARLEEFAPGSVEWAGGERVLQYRGGLLPLVDLARMLSGAGASPDDGPEVLRVVVIEEGSRRLGLQVDEVIDIAGEEITVRQAGHHAGIVASAVVAGRVTDVLDLDYIWRLASSDGPPDGVAGFAAALRSATEEVAHV